MNMHLISRFVVFNCTRTTATVALAIGIAMPAAVSAAAPGRDARPAHSQATSHRATSHQSAPVRQVQRPAHARYNSAQSWRSPGYVSVGYRGGHYRSGHNNRHWGYRGWVGPTIGLSVPLLPLGYSSLWVGGSPYYYANDVYYARSLDGYRVASSPYDDVAWHDTYQEAPSAKLSPPTPTYVKPATASAPTDELVITPRNKQTETQKSFDRIDCERAAIVQTGFDPAAASGEALRKADYVKAVSACLEGKGYSVK
jgi:hypothetical protein